MTQKVNVYIGRFQPLHLGHAHIFKKMFEGNSFGVILIGSAFQARTIKNPFTFDERKKMVEDYLASINIGDNRYIICPLADQPYNDSKWIQSVQETVGSAISERFMNDMFNNDANGVEPPDAFETFLVGSDRDASTWYLKAFPQFKRDLSVPTPEGSSLNATAIREKFFHTPLPESFLRDGINGEMTDFLSDLPKTTHRFLESFVQREVYHELCQEFQFIQKYKKAWEVAPYAPIFSCVDAVVIQSGHILAIQRGALPGRGLWALPGGFVGQRDRLVDAAIRELIEETGIKIPEPVLRGSIKAKEIFDAPDRSLRGRTITTAFLFRLDDTKPLPRVKGQNAPLHETGGVAVVETLKAKWIPISEARANPSMWFDDHHAIIDVMIGLIKD